MRTVPLTLDPAFVAMQQATGDNPYRTLILAILHRALEDAQGRCVHLGNQSPAQITERAQAWLQEGEGVTTLLELAGYEAAPILQRIRQALA